ncbi:M61 family peptidase [Granulicella sp. WH15]|uniref:M61 family metallopeptidase n=1 Tax=Granulicella sp. WH15 TaxID=2602070 RepID=UPI00136771A0|nr:M61 family peptidase [Granulicella sp. WH15]QHN04908.1 M61 family peptidase [Granulicella sp. WH15]
MSKVLPALFASVLFSVTALAQNQTPIQITADLTEGARHLYHAEIDLPVQAGPATFTTPVWIPGNHAPNGPLPEITGVVFTANGQRLAWRRDDVKLSEFHVVIPKGVTTLHAHLDCIMTGRVTSKMAVLEWEQLMLYPANIPVKNIAIQPSVTVPAGWGTGTALTPIGTVPTPPVTGIDEAAHVPPADAVTTKYAVTNVEQLEDSPVLTGRYFHEFPLAPEISPKHFLDVAADEPEDAQMRPEVLAEVANLVREADADYASHHYNAYHFILTLSDLAGGEGLEHGQSSDNGVNEKSFSDDAHQLGDADLLAHEFTHSWNGKYRRPARLYQPDFATPQQGDLLWVYEGMTQYLGNVLAARAGLKNAEQYRDLLALSAAQLDNKPGREWRTTEDTGVAGSLIRGGYQYWVNWRRGQDYYQEGELLWLDADTLIRKLTDDKKSLNDFEKIFLGKGGNTGPLIVGYELPEIADDLNQVVKYDWLTFLKDRINNINPRADLAGIEQGGYKLVYLDHPSKGEKTLAAANSRRGAGINVWYSLGLRVTPDGQLGDIRWSGPADKAKLSPGEKIIAVNGRIFSGEQLHAAIVKAKTDAAPIHLIVQQESSVFSVDIDYHDGERYPSLVRVDGTPDYLDEITKPLTTPKK